MRDLETHLAALKAAELFLFDLREQAQQRQDAINAERAQLGYVKEIETPERLKVGCAWQHTAWAVEKLQELQAFLNGENV